MKFELITPELLQVRESMGLVKDVYDPISAVREPLSAYKTMLDLIHRDPTLATAYNIVVDFLTYRGYDFTGGTKSERDAFREIFYDLNFQQVSPNICYALCYYGDAFLELRKNNSEVPNEIFPLETTEMRIQYDEHGKVGGYVQRQFNIQGMTEEEVLKKYGLTVEQVVDKFKIYNTYSEVMR